MAPILSRRCFACHGPDQAEGGLRLDRRDAAVAGADSGLAAIVPGDASASEAMRRVLSEDQSERMPPEGEALTADERARLRDWIDAGAEYRGHWAFEPVRPVTPPGVRDASWGASAVDRFVLARLEGAGLAPSPPAPKQALVRRLYYDLIGLPPTPEQVASFVADERPDAYEELVERLLASPHYGEKWARHWLDVVRYGETNSFERDAAKPNAWKYRDYVIRSLNEDKPYDRFLIEQLAGDEVAPEDHDAVTATGYFRLGIWDDEPADPLQARCDELDNLVSTTGQAMLGLTVGCARCHDHKIDPIPQADYYGLAAFFADVTPYAAAGGDWTNNQWDLSPPEVRERRRRLEERLRTLAEDRRRLEQLAISRMEGADQRRAETDERDRLLAEKLDAHQTDPERSEYGAVLGEIAETEASLAGLGKAEAALALAVCDPRPPRVHIKLRGDAHSDGDAVDPHFPALFGDSPPPIPPPPPGARSAGRRRVLAEWIASPGNRLTSRVIVNRVWQHHFGRGIVRTPNNFGLLGAAPTHPELLDWLAGWFVENGWRLKPLHRLLVTSSVYRMSSTFDPAAAAVDPANNLIWRFDPRRLSAEEIRDTALAVSGRLDRSVYGPSVYPRLSDEVLHTQSRPGDGWDTSDEAAIRARRRSVYIFIKRSLIPPELAGFDFPETDSSCEARFQTVQPAQALCMLHGRFFRDEARALAERVASEGPPDAPGRVALALRLALQREADPASVEAGVRFVDRRQRRFGVSADDALADFCLVAMNLNEFVHID